MRLGRRPKLAPRLAALRAAPELGTCSDRQLRSLLPHFDEVTVPAAMPILIQGRLCTEFVVIVAGRLRAEGPAVDAPQ
ncbi:MAG: hypothetical protein M3024_04580, partial [Candidatus Dormibacteraeota bacterium]|nr:hypothetical protein [Candidatus Dormibacteraeota bacterium]